MSNASSTAAKKASLEIPEGVKAVAGGIVAGVLILGGYGAWLLSSVHAQTADQIAPIEQRVTIIEQDRAGMAVKLNSMEQRQFDQQLTDIELAKAVGANPMRLPPAPVPPVDLAPLPMPDGGVAVSQLVQALGQVPRDFGRAAFEAAALHVGAPYIWGGKGDKVWQPDGRPAIQTPFGRMVFDRSGLVMFGLWKAGGPDWRLQHSAETLRQLLPNFKGGFGFHLRFYDGDKNGTADHVAFAWGNEALALVLEAAGGGRNTDKPTAGAVVRIGEERRKDLIATRSLILE